ncbi:MAG: ATP-grasp domain-containing protein [Pseudomonadota bacterium]|nr:ATP-grasp domain-containing protein [Pseudomonadota bacterium]
MKKIVVIGSSRDPVIIFYKRFLMRMGIGRGGYCFINSDNFSKGVDVNDEGWFISGDVAVKHGEVGGVWNRLVMGGGGFIHKSIEVYAMYLMDEVYQGVLNRPKEGMSNFSKPYQIEKLLLKRLKKIEGYIFSGSMIRADIVGRKLIYKSISGVRSIVKKVAKQDRERWVKEPVLFQELIHGDNIRVHVIKDSVIACCCTAREIDYRYAKAMRIERVNLPLWLKAECIDVARQMGFGFAGIDLIFRRGEYFILEVNPAPGYAYFDIDLCISRELHKYFEDMMAS